MIPRFVLILCLLGWPAHAAQPGRDAPRPVAPIVVTNYQTRISTNIIAGTNSYYIIGGINEVLVSNSPQVLAASWDVESSRTNDGYISSAWTNAAGDRYWSAMGYQAPYLELTNETLSFISYQPGTLANVIWTNYSARISAGYTNARMWSTITHPSAWPSTPPVLVWATNSPVYGLRGFTALSQCNEIEGSGGQIPMTAITKRHVYARGHGMGSEHVFTTNRWGKKVWFCTSNNVVVQRELRWGITRLQYAYSPGEQWRDQTLFILDEDLPDGIADMMFMEYTAGLVSTNPYYLWTNSLDGSSSYVSSNGVSRYITTNSLYPSLTGAPRPYAAYNQWNNIFTSVAPLTGYWVGGDSGGGWMLPMPGQLVFVYGATTSGLNASSQADMDELTTRMGLNTNDYQIPFYDFSTYPRL